MEHVMYSSGTKEISDIQNYIITMQHYSAQSFMSLLFLLKTDVTVRLEQSLASYSHMTMIDLTYQSYRSVNKTLYLAEYVQIV